MKFRDWLHRIEEGNVRSPAAGNTDQSTALGPLSQFGGERAMLPISYGVDNRAFAGLIGGVGEARAKIRARKGAEPGVASQYHWLDDIRRDAMQTANLPLQLPLDWDNEGRQISISKGLLGQIKQMFGDPLNSDKIYRVDESVRLIYPDEPLTTLYKHRRIKSEDPYRLEAAINYTEALIRASFMVRLSKYSHLLNLDRPVPHQRKIISLPMKERFGPDGEAIPYADGEEAEFYKVMVCAFVFKPINKDAGVDDDIHGEIDRMLADKAAEERRRIAGASPPAPPPPAKKGTSRVSSPRGKP